MSDKPTASVSEARDRIISLIADLQGEYEVMCGRPIDPTEWRIEVPVSDLQAVIDVRSQTVCADSLESLIREYVRDLRRNSSGGDDYPWEWAKGTADYLEVLIMRSRGQS